ncbi:MAG: nitroreductase family deazaflavin-dependent oxidoreductase [Dehalococcoidia bacterium]|nr:nitroreductase family deazaflavin-dependent oxidoreductase [Dehalococcoidia bacterium]
MVWWSGKGLPPARQVVLELRGRKSGKLRSLPVVVATVDGERYLVSMLGGGASWVANARAASPAWLRHGRRETVRLVEVFGPERAPVLREYVRLAPGARPFIPVAVDAPEREFAALVDRYPVFRVDPA